ERNRLVTHLIFYGAGRRCEIQIEGHLPGLNFQISDETERNDVFVQIRVLDAFQYAKYLILSHWRSFVVFVPKGHAPCPSFDTTSKFHWSRAGGRVPGSDYAGTAATTRT